VSEVSSDNIIQQLKMFKFYAGLSDQQLQILENIHHNVQFDKGDLIVKQKQFTKEIYFVLDGTAKVSITQSSINEEIYIATVFKGFCIGHYMVSEQIGRTANVRAQSPVEALATDADLLLSIFDEYKDIGMICYRNLSQMMLYDIGNLHQTVERMYEDIHSKEQSYWD